MNQNCPAPARCGPGDGRLLAPDAGGDYEDQHNLVPPLNGRPLYFMWICIAAKSNVTA